MSETAAGTLGRVARIEIRRARARLTRAFATLKASVSALMWLPTPLVQ